MSKKYRLYLFIETTVASFLWVFGDLFTTYEFVPKLGLLIVIVNMAIVLNANLAKLNTK